MPIFKSKHGSGVPAPPSTVPNADRKLANPLWWIGIKLSALVAVPLVLLMIYGQPGLRIKYTWNGNASAPVYSQCDYLTLLDGWREARPYPSINNCPLISYFPFQLSHLTGG